MATFIVPYYQIGHNTADIQSGWNTPTDASLITGIKYAQSLGMATTIKIHINSYYGDGWAAYINASDREAWFAAYGKVLNHYADLAAANNVKQYVLGNELTAMTSPEVNASNTANWKKLIANVKTRYSGQLTYNANWGGAGTTEEKNKIEFWDDLDTVSLSGYFNLDEDRKASWEKWNNEQIKPLAEKTGKNIVFTEIGYKSVDGSRYQPWNYNLNGPANETEQSDNYDIFIDYWKDKPYFKGFNIWNWETFPNAGGAGNTDYTVQHKQAQALLKDWFSGTRTSRP